MRHVLVVIVVEPCEVSLREARRRDAAADRSAPRAVVRRYCVSDVEPRAEAGEGQQRQDRFGLCRCGVDSDDEPVAYCWPSALLSPSAPSTNRELPRIPRQLAARPSAQARCAPERRSIGLPMAECRPRLALSRLDCVVGTRRRHLRASSRARQPPTVLLGRSRLSRAEWLGQAPPAEDAFCATSTAAPSPSTAPPTSAWRRTATSIATASPSRGNSAHRRRFSPAASWPVPLKPDGGERGAPRAHARCRAAADRRPHARCRAAGRSPPPLQLILFEAGE